MPRERVSVVTMGDMVPPDDVDRGHAWVILVSMFFMHILAYGLSRTTGVFYPIFLEQLDYTYPSEVALTTGLNTGTFCAIGPLGGALINVFGCRLVGMFGGCLAGVSVSLTPLSRDIRYVSLTYGVLSGSGIGLTFLAGMTAMSWHFDKYRTPAISIATAGLGVGVFFYPFLIQALLPHYGWYGALIILGEITCNLAVCAASFPGRTRREDQTSICRINCCAKTKEENKILKDKTKKQPNENYFKFSMFKDINYVLLCFNAFCICVGTSVVYIHLTAYAQGVGIDSYKSAILFSTIGVANFLGRVVLAGLARVPRLSPLILHMFGYAAAGMATMQLPVSNNYMWMHVYGAVFGMTTAVLGSMLPIVILDFIGPTMMANGYGNLLLFEAIGHTLDGPLAGIIYRGTQMYASSMYLGGGFMILGSLLLLWPLFKGYGPKLEKEEPDDNATCEMASITV